jgi:hypothetical protein
MWDLGTDLNVNLTAVNSRMVLGLAAHTHSTIGSERRKRRHQQ